MATAAQAAPTTRRATVDFPPNVPVTLALKYSEGKIVSGQYGERVMYTTTDNRVAFVDPPVAEQIVNLGINVRESFTITRRTSGRKGEPAAWEVARVLGEQPNGTLVVPKAPEPAAASSPAPAPIAPKPPARATVSSALVDEANALVDAFAVVLERALKLYAGKVKPDEVRALVVTSYIQRNKLSSVA